MFYTNEAIYKRINRDNKLKNFFSLLIYLIVTPILVYNISLIVQIYMNPEETPSFFGIKTYTIVSGSMEPEINVGDMVISKEVSKEELQVGDIISYTKGEDVITHRIISINSDENGEIAIVTKGDNNNVEDSGTINFNNIEGKVIKVIPKLGNIALSIQNKLFIAIVLVVFYIYLVKSKELQNKKEERRKKRLKYEEKSEEQINHINIPCDTNNNIC